MPSNSHPMQQNRWITSVSTDVIQFKSGQSSQIKPFHSKLQVNNSYGYTRVADNVSCVIPHKTNKKQNCAVSTTV